jgi:hypothetical protein
MGLPGCLLDWAVTSGTTINSQARQGSRELCEARWEVATPEKSAILIQEMEEEQNSFSLKIYVSSV